MIIIKSLDPHVSETVYSTLFCNNLFWTDSIRSISLRLNPLKALLNSNSKIPNLARFVDFISKSLGASCIARVRCRIGVPFSVNCFDFVTFLFKPLKKQNPRSYITRLWPPWAPLQFHLEAGARSSRNRLLMGSLTSDFQITAITF